MSSPAKFVYIGTYTGKGSEGIYRFKFDAAAGKLTEDGLAAKVSNPSFLAVSKDRKHLYCCNETMEFMGMKSGAASSFDITAETGELKPLDQAQSGGQGPCYISVANDNSGVMVANYGSGDVSYITTEANGMLTTGPMAVAHHEGKSVVPKRQDAPHAHSILPDRSGNWAVAVDLGTDEIIAYKLSRGAMDIASPVVNKSRPGSGPRHISFSPDNKFAYVSNELDASISAFSWDEDKGALTEIQHLTTIPADLKTTEPTYPAEVLVHPSGKFVYLSNRGASDAVVIYKRDAASGKLELVGHEPTRGKFPRGMALSPDGAYLIAANQNTDTLQLFRVDAETGKLEHLQEITGIDQPAHALFY